MVYVCARVCVDLWACTNENLLNKVPIDAVIASGKHKVWNILSWRDTVKWILCRSRSSWQGVRSGPLPLDFPFPEAHSGSFPSIIGGKSKRQCVAREGWLWNWSVSWIDSLLVRRGWRQVFDTEPQRRDKGFVVGEWGKWRRGRWGGRGEADRESREGAWPTWFWRGTGAGRGVGGRGREGGVGTGRVRRWDWWRERITNGTECGCFVIRSVIEGVLRTDGRGGPDRVPALATKRRGGAWDWLGGVRGDEALVLLLKRVVRVWVVHCDV